MSRHRTADEVKQHHVESMGKELGGLYHALWNEAAWLHLKWAEYVELFGTKPSRIELVNKAAGNFFRIIQDTLWEDCILHIARLTDPPKSFGNKVNLTIKKLPELISDKKTKETVSHLVDVADEKTGFCRDWRNRHIAHKDFALAMGTGAEPLKAASQAEIKQALNSITDVLNEVSSCYLNSTTFFEGIPISDGAYSLLHVLDIGLRTIEEQIERVKAGEYPREGFQPRDL